MNPFKVSSLVVLASLTMSTVAHANIAKVTGLNGTSIVERAGKQMVIKNGDVLQEGDRLITTGNGQVQLQFDKCPAGAKAPNNTKAYGSSSVLNISAANSCGNAQKVRLRTETVQGNQGFRPVTNTVQVPRTISVPAGVPSVGAGAGAVGGGVNFLAIGAGVIGAGLLINEINKDDDTCVSNC